MDENQKLEELVRRTIEGAIQAIPAHLYEVEASKEVLKVTDKNEFVYGLVMGMGLGMATAAVATFRQDIPTSEDLMRIKNLLYKMVPIIRENIFK
ncbi:MAG TPA: hypothetical protein VLD38_09055 [Nitrosopumilaceae archaeon]|nr:hypothetical protein [Nitrosopumilaceae archaeon]